MFIWRLIVFIFGAAVGSFLNVCIYRMPQELSIIKPRSFCPNCKKTIPWYDNIPLLSYIILGAKCRFCKVKIPVQYFIVELITALMFLALFNRFGLSYDFFVLAIFVSGLIASTFIDIGHRIIPDEISIGGIIAGFILISISPFFRPGAWTFGPMLHSFIGILAGGGIIYLTGVIFDFFYFGLLKKPPIDGEKASMGGGDIKLLAMIGAFLGWKLAILTFFIAPFFGAALGVFNLIVKKDHTIPYGPFLSLGAIIALFWGNLIIRLILGV